MDLSKVSPADKRILYAAIGVVIGGIVGIIDAWGAFAYLGLIGGVAAGYVVLQPQLAPAMKLPMQKPQLLLACGVIAAGGFALAILTYLRFALDITRIYSILFDLGFVAALALLWFTWTDYKMTMPAPAAANPAPAAATTPEPPAPPTA
ncbi:MAG TPA: hypothetical protein VJ850_11545 [Candidatus Limnocylindrales bacterium]|nr:hypothetical protein [Candidatus Limnocylindrales bacterium]